MKIMLENWGPIRRISTISEPVSDYYIMLSEINGMEGGCFSSYAEEIEE